MIAAGQSLPITQASDGIAIVLWTLNHLNPHRPMSSPKSSLRMRGYGAAPILSHPDRRGDRSALWACPAGKYFVVFCDWGHDVFIAD